MPNIVHAQCTPTADAVKSPFVMLAYKASNRGEQQIRSKPLSLHTGLKKLEANAGRLST